jgi:hypothetical protein
MKTSHMAMRCQSTRDIESIIQEEFEVVNLWARAIGEMKNRKLLFHDLCDPKSCVPPAHVRCREKVERLGRCSYDELCMK